MIIELNIEFSVHINIQYYYFYVSTAFLHGTPLIMRIPTPKLHDRNATFCEEEIHLTARLGITVPLLLRNHGRHLVVKCGLK